MITHFVEVTDLCMYGKFVVCRLDGGELRTKTAMPDGGDALLLSYGGRRRFNRDTTLVCDLQRAAAFAWLLADGEAGMWDYLSQHHRGMEPQVCPMYLAFVRWLHLDGRWAMGAGDITEIPRYIEL